MLVSFIHFRILYRDPKLKIYLDQIFLENLMLECRKLTSKTSTSSLTKKNADSLMHIDAQGIINEWKRTAPLFVRYGYLFDIEYSGTCSLIHPYSST